jgi:hypothetical protein
VQEGELRENSLHSEDFGVGALSPSSERQEFQVWNEVSYMVFTEDETTFIFLTTFTQALGLTQSPIQLVPDEHGRSVKQTIRLPYLLVYCPHFFCRTLPSKNMGGWFARNINVISP